MIQHFHNSDFSVQLQNAFHGSHQLKETLACNHICMQDPR